MRASQNGEIDMYHVEYRHPGGQWLVTQLPSSLQTAAGLARAVKLQQQPQEVRIEPQRPEATRPARLVDILV